MVIFTQQFLPGHLPVLQRLVDGKPHFPDTLCSEGGWMQIASVFATPWNIAHQAPLSMELSRQEYWSGFPFPSPGDLPDPGIKPRSPTFQADSLPSGPPGKPWMQMRFCQIDSLAWALQGRHEAEVLWLLNAGKPAREDLVSRGSCRSYFGNTKFSVAASFPLKIPWWFLFSTESWPIYSPPLAEVMGSSQEARCGANLGLSHGPQGSDHWVR